jgi:hypothetical protein
VPPEPLAPWVRIPAVPPVWLVLESEHPMSLASEIQRIVVENARIRRTTKIDASALEAKGIPPV